MIIDNLIVGFWTMVVVTALVLLLVGLRACVMLIAAILLVISGYMVLGLEALAYWGGYAWGRLRCMAHGRVCSAPEQSKRLRTHPGAIFRDRGTAVKGDTLDMPTGWVPGKGGAPKHHRVWDDLKRV